MSPDWSAKIEPVPYAKLDNPQSLNLYAYATDAPCNSKKVNVQTEHKAQQQIGPNYTPSGGNETLGVTAGRINNETNGMKDSNKENMPLSGAEKLMAHQRINAERHYGKNVRRRAGMMAPLMSGPGYKRALASTIAAAREDARVLILRMGHFSIICARQRRLREEDPLKGKVYTLFPALTFLHRNTLTS